MQGPTPARREGLRGQVEEAGEDKPAAGAAGDRVWLRQQETHVHPVHRWDANGEPGELQTHLVEEESAECQRHCNPARPHRIAVPGQEERNQ